MTSNVSSFVCFGTEGDYFSPYCTHSVAQVVVCHVFLCVVRIVAPQLCDTILMEEELLHSPRLPDSFTCIAPDTPVHEACFSHVPIMRNAIFLAIQMLAYYFNHIHLLRKQWQRSNCDGYLAKIVVNITRSRFCRLYVRRYWKLLTIVLLEIYTIRQAEFPGLIVHVVASDRHNNSYNKDSHLDL